MECMHGLWISLIQHWPVLDCLSPAMVQYLPDSVNDFTRLRIHGASFEDIAERGLDAFH